MRKLFYLRHADIATRRLFVFPKTFLKKTSARALLGADLVQPLLTSSKVCRGLNTTTAHHHHHHSSPPVHHPLPSITVLRPSPPHTVDEPCPVCRKACLNSFGEHAIHCKELPGFKYRHDWVRDVLCDVLKRAGISAKKEAPVNFLTDPLEGRSTLRPADILVFGWEGEKHACVDLTGVSPLVGLKDKGFVVGQAVLKAEASKVAKHEKACLENQHVFVPFAFDTFGGLAPNAVRLLNRVQKVVNSNSSSLKVSNFVFSRIGFSIQKGVAAQLVARLPAIAL
ncbi:putative exostosin [Helianthus annuus]|nr:putative exostosin [Helianthus annuus]